MVSLLNRHGMSAPLELLLGHSLPLRGRSRYGLPRLTETWHSSNGALFLVSS